MDNKHILVTGGAGFIGSHLIERLLENHVNVTAIDNFDLFYSVEAKKRNIERHKNNPRFKFLEVDICDRQNMISLLQDEYHAIIHLAAKAGVRPSINDPEAYQKVNVYGTQILLEFARDKGIKQFVFCSSSSVYGVNPNVPWLEEDNVLLPISPYAATKVSGELLGHVYSHLFGIRFIALRLFTVYGPRQRPDLAIAKFAKLMQAKQPIPFYGDGTTLRDYTFVYDIVDGLIKALHYSESLYEIINLGNHQAISLSDLVAQIEESLGIKAILNFLPAQEGDVPQTFANIDKARNLLRYEPKYSIKDGIQEYVNWLKREGSY